MGGKCRFCDDICKPVSDVALSNKTLEMLLWSSRITKFISFIH